MLRPLLQRFKPLIILIIYTVFLFVDFSKTDLEKDDDLDSGSGGSSLDIDDKLSGNQIDPNMMLPPCSPPLLPPPPPAADGKYENKSSLSLSPVHYCCILSSLFKVVLVGNEIDRDPTRTFFFPLSESFARLVYDVSMKRRRR